MADVAPTITLSGLHLYTLRGAMLEVLSAIPQSEIVEPVSCRLDHVKELAKRISTWHDELRARNPGDTWELGLRRELSVRLSADERELLCEVIQNAILALDREFWLRMGVEVFEAQMTIRHLRGR